MKCVALGADIGAALFDLDGVVTDTVGVHAIAWKRVFDSYLAERPGDPPVRETLHGIGNRKDVAFLRRVDEQGVRPFPLDGGVDRTAARRRRTGGEAFETTLRKAG